MRIRHGQLLSSIPDREEDLHREIATLQLSALQSIQELVTEAEVSLKTHRETGKRLMEEAVAKETERRQQVAEAAKTVQNGKGKGRAEDANDDDWEKEDDSDDEDEDVHLLDEGGQVVKRKHRKWWLKTDGGKAWKHRHTALQQRRRENLVVAHKVQLLLGDTHFQLKEPDNEKKYYDEAENTRLLLLSGK